MISVMRRRRTSRHVDFSTFVGIASNVHVALDDLAMNSETVFCSTGVKVVRVDDGRGKSTGIVLCT